MTAIMIMAVDDEPATLHMLQMILKIERPEWVFRGVNSGQEALAVALEGDLSLALLDIAMPEMDGIEVCQRLRAEPKTAHIPIVIFTGFDRPDLRERASEAGATDYWTKPFLPSKIIPKMELLLETARGPSEA